ncbi:MAG: response regulator transcription factor [Candidatus Hydrothermarchaeales archaeon]
MNKILLIDDESEILKITKFILEKANYIVKTASSGNEGLGRLEKELPDLILLDAMMPNEDGWKICKKIKSGKKTKEIPVVMFTVHGGTADLEKSRKAGAEAHVKKPFAIEELLEPIKMLLKKG